MTKFNVKKWKENVCKAKIKLLWLVCYGEKLRELCNYVELKPDLIQTKRKAKTNEINKSIHKWFGFQI